MTEKLEMRDSGPSDLCAIEALYPEAFPDEDLLPLVRELLHDTTVTTSIVGVIDSQIVGHVIFTKCGVEGKRNSAALIGPLAVAPTWQRQGIGSALVHAGLQRLRDAAVHVVLVLGDPAYYGRLGFVQESFVEPPFPLPTEWVAAWQSQYLDDITMPCAGKLSVPSQWRQPALWAP
jgi:putative acetyltransferase